MSRSFLIRASVFIVVVVVVVAALSFVILENNNSPLPLVNTFDASPSGFTFRYPDGWRYTIPIQNSLILAPSSVFRGEHGPTFTARRSFPENLDEALDSFLQSGPLQTNGEWEFVSDVASTMFGGREALVADLEGRDATDETEYHTHIIATKAANGFVYIFTYGAPLAEWERYRSTLEAILGSVEIFE